MSNSVTKNIDWAHELPAHWDVIRIKYVADPTQENSFMDGDWIESPYITDDGIRYLTSGNIGDGFYKEQGNGYISEETFKKLKCKFAYPGDLIFSRLNAPFGRACILPAIKDKYVLAVDNVIVRTGKDYDKDYICYVTQCDEFHMKASELAKGTAMRRISRTQLGDMRIPMPPLDEQHAIVRYLDSKCAAIDEAIERHRKIIEKLNEYKVTFLTHVVTHGVNETHKYRNTSIAWAPIIPTHWRVVPVKRLVASIHSGKNITSEDIDANGEFPVYGGNGLRGYYTHFNCDGDAILIGRQGALAGNIHQVSGKYWATDHALITHNTEIVQMTYLAFLFEAMNLNQYAFETAAQPGLAASKILALPTILPPLKEQEKIVNVIKKQQQNIDVAKCRHQDIISKLEEYRKSIIYNAVTGKIDCREAVK